MREQGFKQLKECDHKKKFLINPHCNHYFQFQILGPFLVIGLPAFNLENKELFPPLPQKTKNCNQKSDSTSKLDMDPRTKLQLEFNLDLGLTKIAHKPKNRPLAKTGLKLSPQIQVYRFRFSIFFN